MSVCDVIEDKKYKCTLEPEDVEKAKKELGEQTDTRLLEVKQLRSRLEKVSGLHPRVDIKFLLAFLRARKFNQEKAFQLVTKHYREKKSNPSHYEDLKPSKVKHVIDDDIIEVLPERDAEGCRVIITRPGRWDPDRYPAGDIIKLLFIIFSKLSEEEQTQVSGIHMIDCLTDLGWKQGSQMSPSLAKLMAATFQDMCPLRLRRLDIVDEPSFFHVIFPIFKSFMKEKLVKRIHMNSDKTDGLFTSMAPEFVPSDIQGGKLEPFVYSRQWMSKLLECDDQFEYSNKFGYLSMSVENEKQDTRAEDADLKGMGGTFKKLAD